MLDLSHKNLDVYKFSLLLLKEVYILTKTFPKAEIYVLTYQMRRSSISICSNIAEGASRKSSIEKKRFFEIARGSAVELDTQIEISISLDYVNKDQIVKLQALLESVFRMLSKMIDNLAPK